MTDVPGSVVGSLPVVDRIVVDDAFTAVEQTMAADREGHRGGSDRGASPQVCGLVPSIGDPGPWTARGSGPDRITGPTHELLLPDTSAGSG